MDAGQLLNLIIRPVLKDLGLHSEPAERLVLGTACQESHCGQYIHQLGNGPAKGIFQCEPFTHDDLWASFLQFKPDLAAKVQRYTSGIYGNSAADLPGNLWYATAICRIHYLRAPEAIPDNLPGIAQYWKTNYNSNLGKGTVEEFIANWRRFVPMNLV